MTEMAVKEKWVDELKTNAEVLAWIIWGFGLGLLTGVLVMLV